MNTPGHLLVGAAVFARPPTWRILVAALLGAAAPDLSIIGMVWWAENVQGHAPQVIFNDLYFSQSWQAIFAIDNSIPIWTVAFGLAIWKSWAAGRALTGAGLLHLLTDLLLHNDDGRAHFWPFTYWKFESPVSYWDGDHYGTTAAVVLFLISMGCFAMLFQRFESWIARGAFAIMLLGEAYFAWIWITYF